MNQRSHKNVEVAEVHEDILRGKKKDYSKYTKERLIKELHLLREQKKFGLVWEDKTEDVVEMCKTQAPILKPVSKMSVAGGKDEQGHIMIEGDNYHALEVLNYTHKGKIDVIYIDPPYNTGNKDFKYNDKYVDKEDGYRHSKWLSFIDKRLRAAKPLLSDKGAIFISIDDNEQSNLRLLCDEVFGEKNFVANIIWQKKYTQSNDARYFSTTHDFIFCYAKDVESLQLNLLPRTEQHDSRYKNPDNDPKGSWKAQPLHAKSGNSNGYSFTFKNNVTWRPPVGTYPRYSEQKLAQAEADNEIWFGMKGDAVPSMKKYLDETRRGVIPKTIWLYDEVGSNDSAKRELKGIVPENTFGSPKPVTLVRHILGLKSEKGSVVLDFFAGSGTTGHAVMELNKEDGGNRQFILCTNNENNNGNGSKGIAQGVCQPRIKKVMKGYQKNGSGDKVDGLGGSLEYLKTEFVDVENISTVSDKKKLEFTHQAGHTIALKENTFAEVEKNDWYQIFTDDKDKFVGVYFREDLAKLGEFEKKILDNLEVKLYIFSYGGNDDWRNDYAEYENVSVESIPEPILRVYKSVNW